MNNFQMYPKNNMSFDHMQVEDAGLNERTFSPEDRYKYSVLTDQDGTKYFSKELPGIYPERDAKWATYLARESTWAQFAAEVGQAYPELGLDSLVPLQTDTTPDGSVRRIIYPYIDAPFVADPSDSSRLHDKEVLERYVDVLLATDRYAANWTPAEPMVNFDEHTPYNHLDKRWGEWARHGKLLDDGIITDDMLNQARTLVNDYRPYVQPRMQHGDFTPWHLFDAHDDQGNSKWVSFDGEHASMLKPRFYDLAYSYSRIFTRAKDPMTAETMLAQFAEKGSVNGQFTIDELANGFIPVLMSRSIGMFLDAQNDRVGVDYFDEAHELFKRCISRDFAQLIGK